MKPVHHETYSNVWRQVECLSSCAAFRPYSWKVAWETVHARIWGQIGDVAQARVNEVWLKNDDRNDEQ